MKYDVIVVGAGPAGIFTCYELIENNKDLKVLLIEKGDDIYSRKCPILEKKIKKCPPKNSIRDYASCHPACAITNGFGGAGAYSDGKFNITSEFGGWMQDYLHSDEVLDLIKYVDEINLKFGATETITDPTTDKVKEIERKGLAVGLKLLRSKVRHLGTEENLEILKKISKHLESKIDMIFKTKVTDLVVEDNEVKGVVIDDTVYNADKVVIVPGRDGSAWLTKICDKYDIKMTTNQVDIGVRVELADEIMEEINEHLYEGKFIYNTSVDTVVRTFCSNPSGHVVVENHSGTMLANGHAYKDAKLGSNNTNFALLVSHKFSDPFKEPNEYAAQIGQLANKLSLGSVIVQRYGDILRGRRSTQKGIEEGFTRPTLKEAIPGDLALVLPYKTMKSLIEMVEALDHITPGIATEHTLFYGVEAKFYSARPALNDKFETTVKGLYAGGDGAGLTRGLAQAGACGVHIARDILGKGEKSYE